MTDSGNRRPVSKTRRTARATGDSTTPGLDARAVVDPKPQIDPKEGGCESPTRLGDHHTPYPTASAPRTRLRLFVASSVVGQANGDSPPLIIQMDSGYTVYYSYQNLHVTRVAQCAHAVGTEPRTLAMPARSPLYHTSLSDPNPRLRRSWRCIGGKLYLGDSKLAINIKP